MNEKLKKYVQAYLDGEDVEYKDIGCEWKTVYIFEDFDHDGEDDKTFRIKPKGKVKMWQWIFAGDHYAPNTTSAFYKNEEDARKYIESHADIIWIKKAEWTEIKV